MSLTDPRLFLEGHEVLELRLVGLTRLPGGSVEGLVSQRLPLTAGVAVTVDGEVLRDGDLAEREGVEHVLDRGELVVAGHDVSLEAGCGG